MEPEDTRANPKQTEATEAAGATGPPLSGMPEDFREHLVAYLDGELGEQGMQSLDDMLSESPTLRVEVEQLRQTWDLLDVLPRPAATEEFSAQTMASMRAVAVDGPSKPSAWPRRGALTVVWAAALAVSAVTGVLLAGRFVPDPIDRLLTNLSLIERLNVYKEIGSAEFLQQLKTADRFPREEEPAALGSLGSPVSPEAAGADDTPPPLLKQVIPDLRQGQWDRVAALSQDRRKRLAKNLTAFDQLAATDRRQLERLDEAITGSDDLADAAGDYHDWLKTLKPWQREELRETTVAREKVVLVEKYLDEQKQKREERSNGLMWTARGNPSRPVLPEKDFGAVMAVIESRLRATPAEQEALEQLTGSPRHLSILELSVRQSSSQEQSRRWPQQSLVDAIVEVVSDEGVQKVLERSAEKPDLRRQQLARLIVGGLFAERRREYRRQRPTNRQLQELFVKLSPAQQDSLMQLPPADSQRRLRWMYHSDQNPGQAAKTLQRLVNLSRRMMSSRSRRFRGRRGGSSQGPPPVRPPTGGPRAGRGNESPPGR